DPAQDLYYAAATTPRRLAIRDFQSSGQNFSLVPITETVAEYQGRLYWIQYETSFQPLPSTLPGRLVSANPDGSDRKTVLDLTTAKMVAVGELKAYQGSLYCTYLLPQKYGVMNPTLLCRLHPERTNPMELLRSVSGTVGFHDGYLYFAVDEKIGSLWNTLA